MALLGYKLLVILYGPESVNLSSEELEDLVIMIL